MEPKPEQEQEPRAGRAAAAALAVAQEAQEAGEELRGVYREAASHVAAECTYKTCQCLAVRRKRLRSRGLSSAPTVQLRQLRACSGCVNRVLPFCLCAFPPKAFELRRFAGLPPGLSLAVGGRERALAEQHIQAMRAQGITDLEDSHTQQKAVASLARGAAAASPSADSPPEASDRLAPLLRDGFSMLAVGVGLDVRHPFQLECATGFPEWTNYVQVSPLGDGGEGVQVYVGHGVAG